MNSNEEVRRRGSLLSQNSTKDLKDNSAYDNPAFNDITDKHRNDPAFVGSSNFTEDDSNSNKNISASQSIKSALTWIKNKARSGCKKKLLYRRLPILSWLPKYDSSCAAGDFVAGITVGLTLIPQALAYSSVAGVPPQYGLYGSFLGCFVYIIFGSCKDVPVGPSAIISLLTFQFAKGRGIEHVVLLCFLTGVVQVLMGVFGLGFIIDFVSGPVSSGFTSAASLIILTAQLHDIFGIEASGGTFLNTWRSIIKNAHSIKLWDTVFGISCIALLLIMRIVGTQKIGPAEDKNKQNGCQIFINKVLWIICSARNAILVVVCAVIGYSFSDESRPFKVIEFVPPGMPDLKLPPFGYEETRNGTVVHHSFWEMVSDLGSGIIIVPLICLLENIASCKAFANGKPIDATQELIAIGLCNVANSFVQSMPGTGALARSAVNNSSGVRTPLGGLYTGLLVIASLLLFTPYFYYIPRAALAGLIIAAVVFMVEVKVVRPMWRSKKSCFVVCFATFVACLVLRLEIGILVGIGINVVFILYHAARPKISIEKLESDSGRQYLMLTPDRCLIFPSVDYVRKLVTKHSIRQGIPVVIDCSHIYGADYTAATIIEILTQDFAAREQPLFFYNLKPSVYSTFEGVSPKDFVVYYNGNEIDQLLKDRSCIKKELEISRV